MPLFPLGTVLFPGMVLPLRVFEPRYLALIRRLLDLPDGTPREFGVVAIRQGWEVGVDGVSALYRIGCLTRLRRVAELDDGTYEIVTVGAERFRIAAVDTAGEPYLQAEIERLPDPVGPAAEAQVLMRSVGALYLDHLGALSASQSPAGDPDDGSGGDPQAALPSALPGDPLLLASLVATTTPLELSDRQDLLTAPDGVARLRAELRLLKREATMFRRLRAVPVPLAQLRVPLALN